MRDSRPSQEATSKVLVRDDKILKLVLGNGNDGKFMGLKC